MSGGTVLTVNGPINDVASVLSDPHVRARNMVVSAEGRSGKLEMAGNPIKLSTAPDPETREAAPELDADREAILAELRRSDD